MIGFRKVLPVLGLAAVVLVFPALLAGIAFPRRAFDDGPLRRLREEKPDYVLIGDSILITSVDPAEMSRLAGAKVSLLADYGSASARWYLFFKNYLVESGVKPKHTFLFFRDYVLSWPTYRTTGSYRKEIEATMRGAEPVYDRLQRGAPGDWRGRFHQWSESVYPIQRARDRAADFLSFEAMEMMDGRGILGSSLMEALNDSFKLKLLRRDVPTEMGTSDGPRLPAFDPSPEASFLPHIVALAKGHDLPLTLVRTRRRPRAGETARRQTDDLVSYTASLQEWAKGQGVGFIDLLNDAAITPEMFGDGDHIAEEHRAATTAIYRERLRGAMP